MNSRLKCKESLMVQWLRICLSMQETQVRSLVREDCTCLRATKPVLCCQACTLEPELYKKRSHCNGNPTQSAREQPPLNTTREKHTQQRRSSAAKHKQNKNFIKKEKKDSTIRPEIVKHLEEYIRGNSLPLVYITFFKI